MKWSHGDRSALPKRRLFIDSSQESRLAASSHQHPLLSKHSSALRPVSSHGHQEPFDSKPISNYKLKGLRPKQADAYDTYQSSRCDSENERYDESRVSESQLFKIQRQSHESLSQVLRRLDLEDYEAVFNEHQITSEDLPHLTRDDFADMGIPIGPRNRILKAMQEAPSLSSKRGTPSSYQASPQSSCSRKSAARQQLHQEVQQFISVINRDQAKLSPKPATKPPVAPEHRKPQDSTETMARLIEDLARRQELMMKAIEQNSYAMKVLAENQSRAPSPMPRPRSVSMKRV